MKQRPNQDREPEPFVHKKSLGQNFLTSAVVPGWLCEAADLKVGETVLEIGPGTGRLTTVLLERGARVVAIEADERAITILKKDFAPALASGQLCLHHLDARELDVASLGLKDKQFSVVANIPYYLSGFLLRRLLETTIQPSRLVFLLQRELVARIARDKKESLLSLSVKAFGNPVYVKTVSRGHFNPPPKVDSAILAITNISNDRLGSLSSQAFFTLLHQGLGNKRKQLLTNLSQVYDRRVLETIFAELSLATKVRGEDLSLQAWVRLGHALKPMTQ